MTTSAAPSPPTGALDPLRAAQRLHDARPWSDAEAGFRALLARQPGRLDAMRGLGSLAAEQERGDESVHWFRAAVAAQPDHAQAHADLARALRRQGLNAEAGTHFERAAALDPGDAQLQLMARLHRATTLDEQGRADEALAGFQDAVQHHPDAADAWAALGVMQRHLDRPEAAGASFQRALQIDPTRLDVIELFGQTLQDQRHFEDASLVFERLLQLQPDRPLVAGRLMHTKMLGADWTALDHLQQRIEAAVSAGHLAAEPFGLQGYCASPELLLRAARNYATAYLPDRSASLPKARIGHGPKIRVGYVAGEFRNQATSVLLTEVLELHDRAGFEIVAFDNGWGDCSSLRRRIEAATEIVPIRRLANAAAVAAVRERGIDILVNLNGYFGRARHHLFAARPTAIQVNYLGFPGTTGMPYIDYLIADEVVVPPADRHHYTEQVVYLPDAYQPNDRQRRVGTEPHRRAQVGLPEHGFVFCCMNNVYKITPAVFDIWMRLLQRVPGSVLMLYSEAPEAQDNLRREAAARGVEASRIVFGGPLGNEQHLARLRLADLFLDSWPYNAHTTGSDALWAGLPVLTCTGPTFPSRVGASLLHAVGLPELVTESFEAYETLAYRLATEPGLLAGLRERLATNLRTAPLYDTPRYTRHLEAAYRQMVQRARDGLPPAPFACERLP
ncbi:MAG: tetratricopeptide repeat protein [Pseudomonadota bacterium]